MILTFILACVVLAACFFVAGAAWASIRGRERGLRITVRQSRQDGSALPHMMSVQIRAANDRVVHFVRVDMREEGWDEQLAIKVAEMKHKLRTIEAAQRIAIEP